MVPWLLPKCRETSTWVQSTQKKFGRGFGGHLAEEEQHCELPTDEEQESGRAQVPEESDLTQEPLCPSGWKRSEHEHEAIECTVACSCCF